MTDIEEPVADEIAAEEEYVEDEGVNGMEDEGEAEPDPEEPPEVVKLFGKWSFAGIEVRDISLEVSCR